MKKSDRLAHPSTPIAALFIQQETEYSNNQQSSTEVNPKSSFRILFAPGADTLSKLDLQRTLSIAKYLLENVELHVSLNGFADPRGTDEYNNVLSIERTKSIKIALIHFGVSRDRISIQGHGSSFSKATRGDMKAYQQERRVDIETSPRKESTSLP